MVYSPLYRTISEVLNYMVLDSLRLLVVQCFGVFNWFQQSFSFFIKAPTGSGKTVLFELAIVRMVTCMKNGGPSRRCVYMAPTKVGKAISCFACPQNIVRHYALKDSGTGRQSSNR